MVGDVEQMSYFNFKVVHLGHFLDHCIHFIIPTKCTLKCKWNNLTCHTYLTSRPCYFHLWQNIRDYIIFASEGSFIKTNVIQQLMGKYVFAAMVCLKITYS
jgi:hypothetical protein